MSKNRKNLSNVETPVVETPVVETPVVETPVVETPVVETPVVETPVVETPVVETPTFRINTAEQLREALAGKLLKGDGTPSAAACMLAVLFNCGDGVEPSYVLNEARKFGTEKANAAALGNLKHALKTNTCKQLDMLRKLFARSVEAGVVNPKLSFPKVATISGRLSGGDSDETL